MTSPGPKPKRPTAFAELASRSHALVTGGSSGIGLEIARGLLKTGAQVHLVGRSEARLAAAKAHLEAESPRGPAGGTGSAAGVVPGDGAGGPVYTHACDVTDPGQVEALFARLHAQNQAPVLIVNSAGKTHPGRFVDLDIADFEATLASNYYGTLHVLKQAVPSLIERGEGYILNVGSVAGLMGVYGMTTYSSSKFAVRGLTQALRAELKWHGIGVSLLCPPDTDTPMLQGELSLRPPETEALSPSSEAVLPEFVARIALRDWARGKAEILPGSTAWIPAAVARLSPRLLEWIMDQTVRKVRRAEP